MATVSPESATIQVDLRDDDRRRVDEAAKRLGIDPETFVRKAVGDELVLSRAVSDGAEVLLKYPDGTWKKVAVR